MLFHHSLADAVSAWFILLPESKTFAGRGCLHLVQAFHRSRFSIQIHHRIPTHKADDREDLPEHFHLLFGLFSGHNIVIFHINYSSSPVLWIPV